MIKRRYLAISLLSIAAVAIAAGSIYGVRSFNAQAGPAVQKGIARILVLESFDKGALADVGTVYGAEFAFEFDPVGTFINVSTVYVNSIFTYTGNGYVGLTMDYKIGNNKLLPSSYNLQTYAGTHLESNTASQVTDSFPGNMTNIAPGMNYVQVFREDTKAGYVYLNRLELFIEYYYFP